MFLKILQILKFTTSYKKFKTNIDVEKLSTYAVSLSHFSRLGHNCYPNAAYFFLSRHDPSRHKTVDNVGTLRRWTNMKPALGEYLMFVGIVMAPDIMCVDSKYHRQNVCGILSLVCVLLVG